MFVVMVEEGEVVVVGVFDEDGCFLQAVDIAVFAAVGFFLCEFVKEVAGVVDGVLGLDGACFGVGLGGGVDAGVAVGVFGDVFGFADEGA